MAYGLIREHAGPVGCLGRCLRGVQPGDIEAALEGFQQERIRQTSKELLFSRHLGRLKQCLDRDEDWFQADSAAGRSPGAAKHGHLLRAGLYSVMRLLGGHQHPVVCGCIKFN